MKILNKMFLYCFILSLCKFVFEIITGLTERAIMTGIYVAVLGFFQLLTMQGENISENEK